MKQVTPRVNGPGTAVSRPRISRAFQLYVSCTSRYLVTLGLGHIVALLGWSPGQVFDTKTLLHRRGRAVTVACGAQVVSASVDDARRNAELNGISNAIFAVADLEKRMPKAVAERPPPDVVITGVCFLSLQLSPYMQDGMCSFTSASDADVV